jgi:hypothetical protein
MPAHKLSGNGAAVDRALAIIFDKDRFGGHVMFDQVVPADFPFGEDRIAACSPGCNDPRRQLPLIEIERMVKPGFQHRRGPASVLGSTHHHDYVGWPCLIDHRLPVDFGGNMEKVGHKDSARGSRDPKDSLHLCGMILNSLRLSGD